MAVRFIIGRAGSGKTHHCLQAIRGRLRQSRVHGPRLILLVPEQASLQMERAVIAPPEIAGAHRADVVSFRRLAKRILEYTGDGGRKAISEPARAMVLRHLAGVHESELRYFKRVDRLGGFLDKISNTISEFIQEAIAPEQIAQAATEFEAEDAVKASKMHDLALLYHAYRNFLGTSRVDPSQQLELARERIPSCDWLIGAEIWVDGFASLMRQETLTLVELVRRANHMDISLLADPAIIHGPADQQTGLIAQLFSKTAQTFQTLHRTFAAGGIAIEEPICLKPATPPRFASSDALVRLERDLYQQISPLAPDESLASVELVELQSRRIEIEHAIAKIQDWVRAPNSGYCYRDIAVVVRNLDAYHDLIASAFKARKIPYFIDRRRPVTHHPLIELIRTLAVFAEDFSLDAARTLLKTGLGPLDPADCDRLENHLVAQDIKGRDAWFDDAAWQVRGRRGQLLNENNATSRRRETARDRVEQDSWVKVGQARRKLLDAMNEWLKFTGRRDDPKGSEWVKALRQVLLCFGVDQSMEDWSERAENSGDLDLAEVHRQVWRDTLSFLDDFALALNDTPLSLEDVSDVLDAGFAKFSLGLAPPMLDQVLVGEIERSRHPELKAVLILGFNEGQFPQAAQEDPILNDDDRLLLEQSGLSLLPTTRVRTLEESLLVYVAVTRPRERLVISYARENDAGAELLPSPALTAVRQALGGCTVKAIFDPAVSRELWDVQTKRDLAARIAVELRERPSRVRDDEAKRRVINELYDATRVELRDIRLLQRAMAGLGETNTASLSPASVAKLIAKPMRTSVSQLESYATCPFQHFARHLLRVRVREEAQLEAMDVGHLQHAVLEEFINVLVESEDNLADLTDEAMVEMLKDCCAVVAKRVTGQGKRSKARDRYIIYRTFRHVLRILKAQRAIAAVGDFDPIGAEVAYGTNDEKALPALTITLPNNEEVKIRGYVDRVDRTRKSESPAFLVIDYKRTRNKRLDTTLLYHGLAVQLVAYLLALKNAGKLRDAQLGEPAGALFVSLVPRYESTSTAGELLRRPTPLAGTEKPRGIIREDLWDLFEAEELTGYSDYYAVMRKKDESFGQRDKTDSVTVEEFEAVLEHTRTKLAESAQGILSGTIPVLPYRYRTSSPCSWCEIRPFCRFEVGISQVRQLESIHKTEALRRM